MNGSGRPAWLVLGLGAVALFGVLALAGVPLGSLLILGVLLTCPLMMAGMHLGSGHDGHDDHDGHAGDQHVQERRGHR